MVRDAGKRVANSVASVQSALVEGAVLTVFTVFLFLNSWRSTVITGLALPVSVLASFMAVLAMGFKLETMSLLGLTLAIGIIIDDAIVVRENIVRHVEMGKDHYTAAREGTAEIGMAVAATTWAIVVVFVPIAFMGGMPQRWFAPFALTMVCSVLVSLFVSFSLDPMLSAYWPEPHLPMSAALDRRARAASVQHVVRADGRPVQGGHRLGAASPLRDGGADAGVVRRRARAAGSRLGGRRVLPGRRQLGVRGGDHHAAGVEHRLHEAEVGGGGGHRPDPARGGVHLHDHRRPDRVGGRGQRLRAAAAAIANAPGKQDEVAADLRDRLTRLGGVEAWISTNFFGNFKQIQLRLTGPDAGTLAELAERIRDEVRQVPGAVDVGLSTKGRKPELDIEIDRGLAGSLGVTVGQLAQALRPAFAGIDVGDWVDPEEQTRDVYVRLAPESRRSVQDLSTLPLSVQGPNGPSVVPLGQVASISSSLGPARIDHFNRDRVINIEANTQDRSLTEVVGDIERRLVNVPLPPGYRISQGGETADQQEVFGRMLAALGLAIMLMYFVLVLQFGSFLDPLAIMISLPLSLIGVMLALLVTGSTLNLMSMIGVVLLMGLVAKNAILLIDFAKWSIEQGADSEGRPHRGRARAPAADPDDELRAHRRHAARGDRARRGRRLPRAARTGRDRRPDHLDVPDVARDSDHLRHDGQLA